MTNVESYRGDWTNATAFSTYDERRSLVGPALSQLITDSLDGNFAEGAVIVEIGAGGGALRQYGGQDVDNYRWLETDQNPEFLELPRVNKSTALASTSSALPFASARLDGVIGLGVLDTLSIEELYATAEQAQQVLKRGGKVLHLLDMTPEYIAEIRNASKDGLFPVLYKGAGDDETLGIHYVALKNLRRRIERLPIEESTKNVFWSLVEDPDVHVPRTNRTGILQYLGNRVAEPYGMVVKSEPSWLDLLGRRLKEAFEASGFVVQTNGVSVKEVEVAPETLPEIVQQRGVSRIIRRHGFVEAFSDSDVPKPEQVTVIADSHVFVAEKQ